VWLRSHQEMSCTAWQAKRLTCRQGAWSCSAAALPAPGKVPSRAAVGFPEWRCQVQGSHLRHRWLLCMPAYGGCSNLHGLELQSVVSASCILNHVGCTVQ
jgi:hypothetical protein